MNCNIGVIATARLKFSVRASVRDIIDIIEF